MFVETVFFTALRVFSLMRLDRVTNEVTSRTPVSPWGGLDTLLPSSLSASLAHCLLFPQEPRGFLWFSPFLVSCPVSSAIFSFSFGSETGDHGTASTLVSMVDEGGGGVYNFVFLLCLFRYASALSFQGVHIHRILEYFLVFQLYCFFEVATDLHPVLCMSFLTSMTGNQTTPITLNPEFFIIKEKIKEDE